MKNKKIIIYILLISWMGLIFFFSHQSAIDSDKVSSGVIDKIIHTIEIISNHKLTDNELELISNYLVFPIRKLAHFTLYFILGILFYNLIKSYIKNNKKRIIVSLLFCLLYACSDEIHQIFIPGRSGEIRDVLIDSIGSFMGIILIYVFLKRKDNKNEEKNI
ncbi:MAG: VanZ family protein [Bacilli bacterium]|nr:VanZ family protein [Bacilli bacterium]